jgi:CheY-like chemotaxis protein
MGGEIQVESQVDRGTTMVCFIPMNASEASEVAAQTGAPERRVIALEPGQPAYRILAVDDHWTSRQLLVRLLVSLGFEVREAGDGQEALAVWEAWSPHLIWMDLRMPVIDGYETTRRIKATPKGQATRIIALTASSFEEERSAVLATGCDDFLRKPFHEADLFDMMRKHLGLKFVYGEKPVSAPPTTQPTVEALAALPRDLLVALEHALAQLDIKAIDHVMNDIRAHDVLLADALTALVKDFHYGKILRLIQHMPDQAGGGNEHGIR